MWLAMACHLLAVAEIEVTNCMGPSVLALGYLSSLYTIILSMTPCLGNGTSHRGLPTSVNSQATPTDTPTGQCSGGNSSLRLSGDSRLC